MSAVRDARTAPPSPITVEPAFPLSLLESVKAHDLPSEILEDEDLATSLPRRLGLTGVVENQIHRYRQEYRRGRPVPLEDVLNLLRLVLRRPDAEMILRDAGQRIARRAFDRRNGAVTSTIRKLPKRAAFAAARRAVAATLRGVNGQGTVEFAGKPLVVRVSGGFAPRLEPAGTACALYAGVIEETVELYTRERREIVHSRCDATGDFCCEWKVAD